MTASARRTVAMVGFGDFTKLMIRYLSPHMDIVVASRRPDLDKAGLVFEQVSDEEALAHGVIIPSIPAQHLEDYFTKHAAHINPEALVIDVCSVKVRPVEVLQRVLPSTCRILATHPMFGPASAAETTAGQRMMLHPVRMPRDNYEKLRDWLRETFELKIIECTPEEHDRDMAYVLGLTQYLGRIMQQMDIPDTQLMTNAYADLLDMKRIQGGDSWELFRSIMLENPHAAEVNRQLKQAMRELDAKLGIEN